MASDCKSNQNEFASNCDKDTAVEPALAVTEDMGHIDQSGPPKLSKNQQKRLRRTEMKMKFRAEKRKLERERKKERIKNAKLQGLEVPLNRKQLRLREKDPIDISVVIDSSFESYMSEADIKKLIKQIQRCYSLNRRAEEPFKLHVTSFDGKVKEIIGSYVGASNWTITWSEEPYHKVFPHENLVYLSSESENILDTLDTGKVYVIGGLVDHNSQKGLCHKLAVENNISHAQLPISNYLEMKSRKVLTIDHVFEILQQYQSQKDWKKAFLSVIPKRKGAVGKEGEPDEESQSEASNSSDKVEDTNNILVKDSGGLSSHCNL